MIRVLIAVVAGWLAGMATWFSLAPVFAAPVWRRRNYRDADLSTSSGLCIVLTMFVAWAIVAVLGQFSSASPGVTIADWFVLLPLVVALVAGFGMLGLVDDIAGVGESGGFRGHLTALRGGRLTTGGLKLLVGPMVALGVVGSFDVYGGIVGLFRDAAVVALSANLVNLFDRAPGRVIKVSALWFVVLMAFGGSVVLAPVGLAIGAALALAAPDLREQAMLGDVGANALGAVLGFATIGSVGPIATWVTLAVLVGLNVASERVSFSRIIDGFAPLRAVDRWGSLRR